jgi:hypothetical protein
LAARVIEIFSMRLVSLQLIQARQTPNRWSRKSICFQQDADAMELEQLKLLKGRFDPKTSVAGKKGRAVG